MLLFTGLDHWTGTVDWTTWLTFDLILGVCADFLKFHNYGVEQHFLFLKQVQRLQSTIIPSWNTAIVQTSKWPTREKDFHARRLSSVSYQFINYSYYVVAFLVSQPTTTATNMLLLYRHNNAAYMGTAIVWTSKWLTHTCVLHLPRVSAQLTSRIFTWEFIRVK